VTNRLAATVQARPRLPPFFGRSVRAKLISIVLLTAVLVLCVSGTAMLVHDLSVYRESWAVDVASEANILALSAAPGMAFNDPEAAQRSLNVLRSRPAVLAAALYSTDDHIYAAYTPTGQLAAPVTVDGIPEGLRIAGERVELLQRIDFKGEYLGHLYLRARYDVWGRVRAYAGIFAVITALSVLAALIFSSVLQRLITVPLEEIGDVARRIVNDQDYSLRLEQRTQDEIAIVVQALNTMLDKVEDRTQALEASNAALRDADRRKDEFLATLAHELRNPLAPIRHAAKILDAMGATDAQRAWGREVIGRQVEHMALLLEDLMDVSRITRGRLELKRDIVSIERIIEAAIETARPLIDARKHTLEVSLPDRPLQLNVDALRMSQVTSNLLTNAAKYTDTGGKIRLSVARDSDGITISVSDTGIGLTESAVSSVFEMFSQVETALERSQGGLGIGLALVRGLVELHGGTVTAESAGLGTGSTFAAKLPLSAIALPSAITTNAAATAPQQPTSRRKVLVADDNEDAARSLAMLLEVAGHGVLTAHSGPQVLRLLETERPEAFILDIGMPGMTGYDLARQIREQPWGTSVLLIALTGWGAPEDRERAHVAGFDLHFTKPVDMAELEAAIASERTGRESSKPTVLSPPANHR
jgi:signal transduction histidine kinase/ActR/RegA family two-component response regulator